MLQARFETSYKAIARTSENIYPESKIRNCLIYQLQNSNWQNNPNFLARTHELGERLKAGQGEML